MTQLLLECDGLLRKINDKVLFEDLSIKIQAGDRIALTGASGTGKSLLLRTLAKLESCDGGQIRWNGQPVVDPQATAFRACVTYIRQNAARFDATVREVLQMPFDLAVHRDKRLSEESVCQELQRFGRDRAFLDQAHESLSGGEAQMVAMISALQIQPSILLLDEPTSALDAAASSQAEQMLQSWLDQDAASRAWIWVTHDSEQASRVCNRFLTIRDGKLSSVTKSNADDHAG